MVSLEEKLQDSKQNGRWTDEEHELFERALQIYGKKWKKIEAVVGTRTATQIRSHAQKHFLRLKKTVQSDSEGGGSSVSELPGTSSEAGGEPGDVEKQYLLSCIQYVGHLNSLLEGEIRKYSALASPAAPPPATEDFPSAGSAFKRIKLEESDETVPNSAKASQH
jgi:SHAQKYF class myb-like DNA-binding protein